MMAILDRKRSPITYFALAIAHQSPSDKCAATEASRSTFARVSINWNERNLQAGGEWG